MESIKNLDNSDLEAKLDVIKENHKYQKNREKIGITLIAVGILAFILFSLITLGIPASVMLTFSVITAIISVFIIASGLFIGYVEVPEDCSGSVTESKIKNLVSMIIERESMTFEETTTKKRLKSTEVDDRVDRGSEGNSEFYLHAKRRREKDSMSKNLQRVL